MLRCQMIRQTTSTELVELDELRGRLTLKSYLHSHETLIQFQLAYGINFSVIQFKSLNELAPHACVTCSPQIRSTYHKAFVLRDRLEVTDEKVNKWPEMLL